MVTATSDNITIMLNRIIELEREKWNAIISILPAIYEQEKIDLAHLLEPVTVLNLSCRIINRLFVERINFIGDIVCNDRLMTNDGLARSYFLRLPNFGITSFKALNKALSEKNFTRYIDSALYWEARKGTLIK